MKTFKIPSGEITNLLLIEEIAKKNRKIILSTGMSTKKEISDAIKVLVKNGQKRNKISILHCNSEYPTPMKNINLNVMKSLSNYFNLPVGISDHTLGYEVPIAAAALGAKIIEKHFTLNKNLSGPDHKTSLSPSELRKMIKYVRNIEIALGSATKKITKGELENLNVARKSIIALKQIKKGEIFSKNNLTVKRPGNGISPMKWYTVLGKKSKYEFKKDEIIKL
jgi:N,N'-diacetyllegionaminate synthase